MKCLACFSTTYTKEPKSHFRAKSEHSLSSVFTRMKCITYTFNFLPLRKRQISKITKLAKEGSSNSVTLFFIILYFYFCNIHVN